MSGSAVRDAVPPEVAAGGKVMVSRSSICDSICRCVFPGMRIDKEELRRNILMPEYLRMAMATSVRVKDWKVGAMAASSIANGNDNEETVPEAPMVVFVNSRSGGRRGPALKGWLQQLMAEEREFLSTPRKLLSTPALTKKIK